MPGYLLSENTATRWSSVARAARLHMLAVNLAFGVLAGVLAAHAKLHLGLPGHKALFWLAPVLAVRLLSRHTIGAMFGACAAAGTALSLGGSFAGGVVYLPLVIGAGGALDALAAFSERRRLPAWATILLLGMGGALANLLCALNRLLVPIRREHLLFGIGGPQATLLSYALFGLLAGLAGAAIAVAAHAVLARTRGQRRAAV